MSDPLPSTEAESPPLARICTVDAVVAALIFVMGTVVVFEARRLGAGWGSDGPGAGYFPFYIGVILCISSLGILVQSQLPASRDRRSFVDREQLTRVLQVLLPAAAYVLVVWALGLYVASALYIALFMVLLGKYTVRKSLAVALGFNVVFFAMFEIWFKVPLYKGALDPLGFLGY